MCDLISCVKRYIFIKKHTYHHHHHQQQQQQNRHC
jgi:hypothetical protein